MHQLDNKVFDILCSAIKKPSLSVVVPLLMYNMQALRHLLLYKTALRNENLLYRHRLVRTKISCTGEFSMISVTVIVCSWNPSFCEG